MSFGSASTREPEERFIWLKERDLKGTFVLAGLRTYLIGLENGRFEGRWNGIWNLPIKVADGVDFGISLDGKNVLLLSDFCTKFEAHVSHVERTYALPDNIAVNEKVFIPAHHRATAWLFNLENRGRKDVEVKFLARPIINLMWEVRQAGEPWRERRMLAVYDEARKALLFRHHMRPEWIAIFGGDRAPSVVNVGPLVGNMLPRESRMPRARAHVYGDASMVYDLRVPSGSSVKLSFALAGGVGSLIYLAREFDESLTRAYELFELHRSEVMRHLLETTNVSTGNVYMDKAFTWSKVNLYLLKHYQRGYGLGLMAGLPHFPIYFGRDTAWTLFGVNAMGDFETSRAALSLLARFQAKEDGEDQLMVPYYRGEIPHEVRTDGNVIYYSIDATPLFIIAVHDYFTWSGDEVYAKYIYDNVYKALNWCFKSDRDGDGLIDHGPEGFLPDVTWMDSLFRGKSAVDVQAIFAHAFKCGAELARVAEDKDMEEEAERRYERLKKLLNEAYWDGERGFFYDTIRPDNTPDRSLTVNAVVPLFFNLVEEEKAEEVLKKLEGPDFMSDWGVRTRARSDPEYDSESYQMGGVWPLATGWVSFSQFQYGRFEEGLSTILRMAEAQKHSPAYFKEVLPGEVPVREVLTEHPLGCFIQAWSAGIYVHSLIRGLMGVEARAHRGEATVCPYLPEKLSSLAVEKLRIGTSSLSMEVKRNRGEVEVKLMADGGELKLRVGFKSRGPETSCETKLNGTVIEGAVERVRGGYFKVLADVAIKGGQAIRLTYRLR